MHAKADGNRFERSPDNGETAIVLKFRELFLGSLAGVLVAVAVVVLHDWIRQQFYFTMNWELVLFALLIAGAQAFFIGLPGLLLLNKFRRVNLLAAVICGAFTAAAPWALFAMDAPLTRLPVVGWFAVYGAFGGFVGFVVARSLTFRQAARP